MIHQMQQEVQVGLIVVGAQAGSNGSSGEEMDLSVKRNTQNTSTGVHI